MSAAVQTRLDRPILCPIGQCSAQERSRRQGLWIRRERNKAAEQKPLMLRCSYLLRLGYPRYLRSQYLLSVKHILRFRTTDAFSRVLIVIGVKSVEKHWACMLKAAIARRTGKLSSYRVRPRAGSLSFAIAVALVCKGTYSRFGGQMLMVDGFDSRDRAIWKSAMVRLPDSDSRLRRPSRASYGGKTKGSCQFKWLSSNRRNCFCTYSSFDLSHSMDAKSIEFTDRGQLL